VYVRGEPSIQNRLGIRSGFYSCFICCVNYWSSNYSYRAICFIEDCHWINANELVDFEFNVDTPSRCKIYCIISMSSNVQEYFGNKFWNTFQNFTQVTKNYCKSWVNCTGWHNCTAIKPPVQTAILSLWYKELKLSSIDGKGWKGLYGLYDIKSLKPQKCFFYSCFNSFSATTFDTWSYATQRSLAFAQVFDASYTTYNFQ